MRCQETSGFLTLHQCENQAVRKCHYCKKRICDEHAKPIDDLVGDTADADTDATPEAAGDTAPMPTGTAGIPGLNDELEGYEGAVSCITCMKKRFAEPSARGLNSRKTRWFRNHYYYDPYFYGHYHGYHPYGIRHDYDDGDYRSFEGEDQADHDDLEDS